MQYACQAGEALSRPDWGGGGTDISKSINALIRARDCPRKMAFVAAFGLSLSWLPQQHALTPCISARPPLERAAVAVCVERQAYRPRGRGSAGAVRNQGARTIVTKLTSLRSRNGAVDMDGVGRLLRGYDIQGPMLLDVLQGLKHQDRWEMCQAVARYVEASYSPKRGGVPTTREDLPRFQALSPTDDGEDLDMGQLLAMQGEEVNPLESVLPVDTVHYNVMISACARPRRWKEALELFDRMRKRNVERSTVTYNSLLHVMHRARSWLEAAPWLAYWQSGLLNSPAFSGGHPGPAPHRSS